jgi:hypothetical protein
LNLYRKTDPMNITFDGSFKSHGISPGFSLLFELQPESVWLVLCKGDGAGEIPSLIPREFADQAGNPVEKTSSTLISSGLWLSASIFPASKDVEAERLAKAGGGAE